MQCSATEAVQRNSPANKTFQTPPKITATVRIHNILPENTVTEKAEAIVTTRHNDSALAVVAMLKFDR